MNKIWLIIKYEYHRHVINKRFLFSLLSLPLGIIALMLISMLIAAFSIDSSPVGYIDYSSQLDNAVLPEGDDSLFEPVILFEPYQDETQARADLEDEKIQAYYIIPEGYPESLEIKLVYLDPPGTGVQDQFNQFVRNNLGIFDQLDPQVEERLNSGSDITITALDGSREIGEDQWFMAVMPFIAGAIFIVIVLTSGGYLLQAVVEEKENRTMEIVITSVTPNQLMTGKIIGNIAIGLTQLVFWLIFGWIALSVGGRFWPILQEVALPVDYILVLIIIMLPSFVMVAAIMAAIGATMTEIQEAQQVSGLISLSTTVPFYLSTSIMMNPNGPVAMVLSFFPITAPLTLLMRMGFTVIPVWQIVVNIIILVLFAGLSIWFAGRAFRMGMLRYGKKLTLKEVFRKRA